jgi:hypothetical protein
MVIPHGARPDRRWGSEEIAKLRTEIGLDKKPYLGPHIIGLVGWIQSNKRWDILTSMWEEIHAEILQRTGQDWDILAAGLMRDPNHRKDYELYRNQVEILEERGFLTILSLCLGVTFTTRLWPFVNSLCFHQ